jgi:hypothetical protein
MAAYSSQVLLLQQQQQQPQQAQLHQALHQLALPSEADVAA